SLRRGVRILRLGGGNQLIRFVVGVGVNGTVRQRPLGDVVVFVIDRGGGFDDFPLLLILRHPADQGALEDVVGVGALLALSVCAGRDTPPLVVWEGRRLVQRVGDLLRIPVRVVTEVRGLRIPVGGDVAVGVGFRLQEPVVIVGILRRIVVRFRRGV